MSSSSSGRTTLVKPPPYDPEKSHIENVLEVTELGVLGPIYIYIYAWMFSEIDTPWAGDGRGVVLQRIFAADGTLLATCVQEGLVRLTQEDVDGAAREGGATAKDAGKAKL
ncbi:uncharacterized protein VDAG_00324 [Verticillium dahliae VdLs.17]|uniref:Acyl-CoA thioesterase-like C-terminal domain-containing protein n=1 Tax=Verticillium dahliae (strain VdLs.17 / ATCC MYA-4575 / FGSC 10137) TaxID=498257 RepID=G2WRZ1_VERDV|nr:uncharacterized protein VDAG_00324 [Verticillium dahliae VdLs.17]EGY13642.1 hypothetical protein VDAG_00324 [Verticillium dahliae VdLs.17]